MLEGATKQGEEEATAVVPLDPELLPEGSVYLGQSNKPECILLRLANRHGLITGATGTGKTVTLQGLAESFSDQGVPVFCADVKGDLSGVAKPGKKKGWIEERAKLLGYTVEFAPHPVIFWDLFGEQGHPIRTTVTEIGPPLLSRLMDLSEAQEGALNIAFRIADDEKLPLLDLKDLQSLLQNLAERASELTTKYGNVSKASVGAIQRSLLVLEQQGAEHFFGEPALKVDDLMRTASDGRGYISVLVADKLMESPRLYATFLLFLMSEMLEELPEIGDPEKPKLVFFFDEAHLLFRDAPKALLDTVEQLLRLIRFKGVGVYFVTQYPLDVPDTVSRQLGNRVQHALRAFTPAEQKAVKPAAETFRKNPYMDPETTILELGIGEALVSTLIDTEKVIMELGIGEALVSTLNERGQPSMVEHTFIKPPSSQVGPLTAAERKAVIKASPVAGTYDEVVDRNSAHEILQKRTEALAEETAEEATKMARKKSGGSRSDGFWTTFGKNIIRTVVPAATRMAEQALRNSLKRNAHGGIERRRRVVPVAREQVVPAAVSKPVETTIARSARASYLDDSLRNEYKLSDQGRDVLCRELLGPKTIALINTNRDLLRKFPMIAERKVAILDEYGEENWDALQEEIQAVIIKMAKRNRLSFDENEVRKGNLSEELPKEYSRLASNLNIVFRRYHEILKATPATTLDIDDLSGVEFETWVAKFLTERDFEVQGTPISRDQGADLIAKKDGKTIIIQTKRYEATVGNEAVQDVISALAYFGGDEGWVVTNSSFTRSAKALAQKAGIKLVDGTMLRVGDI